MAIVVLTFFVVLGIVLGAYAVFIRRPEKRAQSEVRQRLKMPDRAAGTLLESVAKAAQPLSRIKWLDLSLQRAATSAAMVQRLIEQGGANVTVGVVLLASGFSTLAGGLIGGVLMRSWAGALVAGCLAAVIPYGLLRHRRTVRTRVLEQQFPEAIDLIARALRAGHPLAAAMTMAAEELSPPVSSEFRLLYERQSYGFPLSEAFREFAERVTLVDARFFATAVMTQREAGGNLAEVLDNLAAVMRERATVKRQMRVISAHGRVTGYVLAALPPVMAIAFMVTSPSHLQMLINDPLGRVMIYGALILQTCGTLLIRKIVNVEY